MNKNLRAGLTVDSSWVTFKHSWPWPWPWIGSSWPTHGIPSCISHRTVSMHTKFHWNRKNFLRTDVRTDVPT